MTARQLNENEKEVVRVYLKQRGCTLGGGGKVGDTYYVGITTSRATLSDDFAEGLKMVLGTKQLVVNQQSC